MVDVNPAWVELFGHAMRLERCLHLRFGLDFDLADVAAQARQRLRQFVDVALDQALNPSRRPVLPPSIPTVAEMCNHIVDVYSAVTSTS